MASICKTPLVHCGSARNCSEKMKNVFKFMLTNENCYDKIENGFQIEDGNSNFIRYGNGGSGT